MIVIGADTHKGSHALAAVDEGTGRVRGSREIKSDDAGPLAAVRWARELDDERVWAIEDCRHVSRRLEQALLAAGERVVRVPPHRMGESRKGEREPGKKGDWPHLVEIRDPAALDTELHRIRREYNTVRLHASIGYVTPDDEHHGRGPAIRRARTAGMRRAQADRIKQNRAKKS